MSQLRFTKTATPVLGLAALAVFLTGSGSSSSSDEIGDRAATANFEELFAEQGRIHLQESPEQPIGAVTGIAFSPSGRLAVADRQSARVFVFDRDGVLQGIVGRAGEGPGEFKAPTDVAFDAGGRLYVSDAGGPRVVRYGIDLSPDSMLRLDEAFYAIRLERTGKNLLAYVNAPGAHAPRLRLLQPDGEMVNRFHPSHPAYVETPYWSAATTRVLAASDERIVAGGNLMYPLVLYSSDGAFVDSIGHPPRSWRQAPRLERGAFRGPNQLRQFAKWRRSFTTIQNVALLKDRYLVVSHKHLNPEVLAYEDAEYFADIYDLKTRDKRWTQVRLPGRLLAGGEHIVVLRHQPPRGWVIGTYTLTG